MNLAEFIVTVTVFFAENPQFANLPVYIEADHGQTPEQLYGKPRIGCFNDGEFIPFDDFVDYDGYTEADINAILL